MKRLWLCAIAVAIAACGTTTDPRPATLSVITLSVLAPSCGQVQCHSSTTRIKGYTFDTVDAARYSLRGLVAPDASGTTGLEDVLDRKQNRMPPDAPLADEDRALIQLWLDDGTPGL